MSKRKSVYEEIEEARKERGAMREDLVKKRAIAEADKAKAIKAANEALHNGNADAYTKANAAKRKAAEEVEFYTIQLKDLDASPLFSNYVEKIAEVKADQQKKIDQINNRATKAMHKINDMIAAFYAEFEETNKALELVYINTGFTYRPTITLPIKVVYKSTEATKANPELSKYW